MIDTMIFDFNGTMFFDGAIQRHAWKTFLANELNHDLTDDEFETQIAGRNNKHTLEYFVGHSLTDSELETESMKKEKFYQETCLSEPQSFHLAPGLEQFLDQCLSKNYKLNIATASEKPNVEFFFKYLNLDRWFDLKKVALNDGQLPGKPAPDMFLRAIQNVSSIPNQSAIFEDSVSGIQSANNAESKQIVLVEDPDMDKVTIPDNLRIDQTIQDYRQLEI